MREQELLDVFYREAGEASGIITIGMFARWVCDRYYVIPANHADEPQLREMGIDEVPL